MSATGYEGQQIMKRWALLRMKAAKQILDEQGTKEMNSHEKKRRGVINLTPARIAKLVSRATKIYCVESSYIRRNQY